MTIEEQQARQQAHELLDLLSPAKLGVVRSLLEVMVDGGADEPVTEDDRRRLMQSRGGGVPIEEVLADFGLTMDDFPLHK